MKKILLSIFLAVCMLLTNVSVMAEDNAGAEYKEAVEFLSTLNIISVTDASDDFSAQALVTREEFCVYLARAFKIEPASDGAQVFTDVPATSALAPYINTLYEGGVVSGYGGTFRPRDVITYNEAVKMLVSALNYDYASAIGGYPEGYQRIASSVGITKGVYAKDQLTKSAAAQLITNAMIAPIMEITGIKDNNITFKVNEDKCILTELYDIYEGEGVVMANGRASFASGTSNINTDEVMIEDTFYKIGKSNIENLLGHYVEFYYRELDDDKYEIVQVLEDRGEGIEIPSERIIDFEDGAYRYEDENGKSKRVRIESDFLVMYNSVYPASGFKPEMMEPEMGKITLIKSGKGNGYNAVIIEEYVNYVVSSVDAQNEIIYESSNSYVNLKGKEYKIFDDEGVEIEFSSIKERNVVSVLISADGEKAIIYVSDTEIGGKVTGTDNTDKPIIAIDSIEYYADEKVLDKVEQGVEYTLYLDYCGKVTGARKTHSDGLKYAYLIKAALDTEYGGTGSGERVLVRLFDEDGADKKLYVAEKVRINDVLYKDEPQKVLDNGLSLAVNLLKYKLDAKGEISTMYVYDGTTDDYIHEMMNGSYIWTASQRSFGGKVTLESDTPVFMVSDSNDIEDFKILGLSSFEDDKGATVKIYTMGDNVYGDVIVRETATSASYARSVAIVKKVITTIDADGETVKKLVVLFNGSTQELALTKEELIGTVDAGDVLKISLNQNNEIQEITHIYDYSAKKFVQTNPYEPQSGAGYRSANRCFHGYAYDITDGLLRFCKNIPTGNEKPETENALLSGFEIYVIDGNEIYVGSESDIKDYTGAGNACSEIIVATQWANPVNIVVIK